LRNHHAFAAYQSRIGNEAAESRESMAPGDDTSGVLNVETNG
jgi:hypothetical protein